VESRRQLRQEIQSIVEGVESSYLAAVETERELRTALDAQKAAALDQKDAGVAYAILEREAETNRELYDGVLQRMKEIGVAAELRASNVFVIDPAQPPLRPSSPRKGVNLALALVFGLLGGVASAFLAERLDDTVKTPQDVERELRLPNLAIVPNLELLDHPRKPWLGKRARKVLPWLTATAGTAALAESDLAFEPDAAVAEAYRAVRTGILLSRAGEPPRTILFTSATGGEGKTVSLLNTAIMFAQLGPPILVVDADLRRPRCHDGLGIDNDIGLTEVLTGQIEAVKAIHPTKSPLSILPSGAKAPNPTELLGSSQMRDFLASMRKRYAYVLIDAPPLLPVSDSVVLSTLVDGVVLVVDRSATPRRMVLEARARLSAARAKVLGVVLNRVDVEDPGYAHYTQGYYS
jgi:capsular exopolysaccharide synthesis family protein